MRLDQFPRPRGDTSIGFHYVDDTSHYDRESLRYWLGELRELGASWLVLPTTIDNPVPEYFLRELIAAHVEPVIRVDVWPIQPIDRSRLSSVCHDYAEWGAYYLYVYSEPNLVTQWRIEDWTAPGLVERFAGLLFPAIETVHQAGLFPLISPLAPGGHYWDLTFLSTLLGLLTREKRDTLRERLGLCIHNYAGNRPLIWGKGGPERWPLVRPYDCPSSSQDHRGFFLFEWYDAIVRQHLGQSLPMICGETGLVPGAQDDPSFPAVDDMTHSMRSVEMARMLMDGELPDYVFNTAFWTLAAGGRDPADAHAWYRRDTSTLPAVRALKELKKRQRRFSWDESPDETKPGRNARPIYHYVLFHALDSAPGPSASATRWMLPAALNYVRHFHPTVGFNTEEARHASRVTIVGNDPQRTSNVEASLRESGCLVETIQADSQEELEAALEDLIRRGRRFRQLPG